MNIPSKYEKKVTSNFTSAIKPPERALILTDNRTKSLLQRKHVYDDYSKRIKKISNHIPAIQRKQITQTTSSTVNTSSPSQVVQLMPWYKKVGIGALAVGGALAGGLVAAPAIVAAAGLAGTAAIATTVGSAVVGGLAGAGLGYGAHRVHLSHLGYGHEMEHGLPERDIHYGINNFGGHALGVREPAMANYGGTVAEYAWNPAMDPAHAQTPFDVGMRAFNQSFNRQIQGPPVKYGAPGMNNTPIPAHLPGGGGLSKLIHPTPAVLGAAAALGDYDLLTREGTRFSKSSIVYSVLQGGTPRFHLDGMGNEQQVQAILNKQGAHADSVTSRELRFIRRYWNRDLTFRHGGNVHTIQFHDRVKFYRNMHQVQAPWEDR